MQERFPWELAYPPADDPLYKEQPGNFTAELHNRITAPLYPLAFLFITYAYLGAPRTTRQSRTMSFVSAALAVSVLRGVGFVGTILGAQRRLRSPFRISRWPSPSCSAPGRSCAV